MGKMKRTYLKRKGGKIRSGHKSISKLVKDLDRLFSLRIRQFYANSEGMAECYTCGYKVNWKKLHCGHYLSRFYKVTRWDENNVRPQCAMCNIWKRGDAPTFREKLVKEIGEDKVLAMEARRREIMPLERGWLEAKIAEMAVVDNPIDRGVHRI